MGLDWVGCLVSLADVLMGTSGGRVLPLSCVAFWPGVLLILCSSLLPVFLFAILFPTTLPWVGREEELSPFRPHHVIVWRKAGVGDESLPILASPTTSSLPT